VGFVICTVLEIEKSTQFGEWGRGKEEGAGNVSKMLKNRVLLQSVSAQQPYIMKSRNQWVQFVDIDNIDRNNSLQQCPLKK